MNIANPEPFVPGQLNRNTWPCPYCRAGRMVDSPASGWMFCTNPRCGAEANIGAVQRAAQRLADKSPPRQSRTTGEFSEGGIQPPHPSY